MVSLLFLELIYTFFNSGASLGGLGGINTTSCMQICDYRENWATMSHYMCRSVSKGPLPVWFTTLHRLVLACTLYNEITPPGILSFIISLAGTSTPCEMFSDYSCSCGLDIVFLVSPQNKWFNLLLKSREDSSEHCVKQAFYRLVPLLSTSAPSHEMHFNVILSLGMVVPTKRAFRVKVLLQAQEWVGNITLTIQ